MKNQKLVYLYVVVLVVLMLIVYVLPDALGFLRTSYIVQYGELKVLDDATGWIARNETIYLADSGGSANYLINQDELVRGGTKVMEVSGSNGTKADEEMVNVAKKLGKRARRTSSYTNDADGLVSYYCDGYENKITPEKAAKIKFKNLEKITNDSTIKLKRSKVSAGEPVFAVVDRSLWSIVCYLDKADMAKFKGMKRLRIEIGTEQMDMNVDYVGEENHKTKLVLTSDRYFSGLTKVRRAEVKIIKSQTKGLLVRNSSIIKKKKTGMDGVYVRNKVGKYVFKPVNILDSDGKTSIVSKKHFYDDKGKYVDTIDTYDQILTNP